MAKQEGKMGTYATVYYAGRYECREGENQQGE